MYFQMSLCIVVIIHIQMVSSGLTLSRDYPPFYCGKSLKLKCQYSGAGACCNSETRVWRLNGSQIMNNGIESTTTGKYTESIDDPNNLFELTIKNIRTSDFEKDYVCVYGFDVSSPLKLDSDHLECDHCESCGGICFAWGCLGTFHANCSLMISILIFIWRDYEDSGDETTEGKASKFIRDGFITVGISILMSFVAFPIGLYCCICYDYGDEAYRYYPDPSFISLGIFVVVVTLLFLAKYHLFQELKRTDLCILILMVLLSPLSLVVYPVYIFKRQKNKKWNEVDFKDICLLLSTVITFGIAVFLAFKDWPTEEKNNPKKKAPSQKYQTAQKGLSTKLECPYQATEGKKINWYKKVGEEFQPYSEGEKINTGLSAALEHRLVVKVDKSRYNLCISDVQKTDAGIYECSLSGTPNSVSRIQLTVSGKDDAVPV